MTTHNFQHASNFTITGGDFGTVQGNINHVVYHSAGISSTTIAPRKDSQILAPQTEPPSSTASSPESTSDLSPLSNLNLQGLQSPGPQVIYQSPPNKFDHSSPGALHRNELSFVDPQHTSRPPFQPTPTIPQEQARDDSYTLYRLHPKSTVYPSPPPNNHHHQASDYSSPPAVYNVEPTDSYENDMSARFKQLQNRNLTKGYYKPLPSTSSPSPSLSSTAHSFTTPNRLATNPSQSGLGLGLQIRNPDHPTPPMNHGPGILFGTPIHQPRPISTSNSSRYTNESPIFAHRPPSTINNNNDGIYPSRPPPSNYDQRPGGSNSQIPYHRDILPSMTPQPQPQLHPHPHRPQTYRQYQRPITPPRQSYTVGMPEYNPHIQHFTESTLPQASSPRYHRDGYGHSQGGQRQNYSPMNGYTHHWTSIQIQNDSSNNNRDGNNYYNDQDDYDWEYHSQYRVMPSPLPIHSQGPRGNGYHRNGNALNGAFDNLYIN